MHLSILHRCFERGGKPYLGVAAMAYLPMQTKPALLSEQELGQDIPPMMDAQIPLDVALPKVGGEFLVVGDACAPSGRKVKGLEVRARVGGLCKRLNVFGRRYWLDDERISDTIPFTRQPIDWANAFGGPELPENPQGRGVLPQQTAAGPLVPLPAVQDPECLSRIRGRPIRPASFAPIPPVWPQRSRFDGTYDDAWLHNFYPGPPADFDWRFHCIAPEDQWQATPFAGTEAVELIHLHPEHPTLRFTLPGIRPVLFVHKRGKSDREASFIETRLTTLWFFPNQLRSVMIWHGVLALTDYFGDEIDTLFGALEWLSRPRAHSYYIEALNARLDREHGGLKILDDHELLPEGMAAPNEALERHLKLFGPSGVSTDSLRKTLDEAQQQLDARLTEAFGPEQAKSALEQAKQKATELGIPDLPRELPDDPKELFATMQALEKKMPSADQIRANLIAQTESTKAEIRHSWQGVPHDAEQLESLLNLKAPSAPSTPALQGIEALSRFAADLPPSPDREKLIATIPKLKSLAEEAESKQEKMLRSMAHYQDPPPQLDARTQARLRKEVRVALQSGKGLAGLDLRGANLAAMWLEGVDFSGLGLEGVDFRDSRLVGARFTEASLAHARLDGACCDGASFKEANLGRASLARASCAKADFTGATLSQTHIDGAVMAGAQFGDLTLLEIEGQASWVGANLEGASFIKCKLTGSHFSHARLEKALFLESDLVGCHFGNANVSSAAFVTCNLDRSVFDSCSGANARFVHGTTMRAASFAGAKAAGTNFRAVPLEQACFTGAFLDGCDFSEANAPESDFRRASLKGALLMKANFAGANFSGTNLMQAILQYAHIESTDFSGSNLVSSDLMRVITDDKTRFDRASMAKARTLPRHRPVQP